MPETPSEPQRRPAGAPSTGAPRPGPEHRLPPAIRRPFDRLRHLGLLLTETYQALRRRRPAFDHLVRAYERYVDCRGDQLAGSVTYFVFLSFFPIIALAFAAVGYLAEFNLEFRQQLEQAIDELLPGFATRLPIEEVAQARTGAGVLGLLGLLYTGLGSLSALREALHVVWLKSVTDRPNFLVARLTDTVLMIGLGAALLASVSVTSVAQAATDWLLALVGLEGALAATATRLLGLAVSLTFTTGVFLVLFRALSGTRRPARLVLRGAFVAAVGFEILKTVGALLIRGTLDNPVYASFAVLVGLMVWINLVARFLLLTAAWTATTAWLPVSPAAGVVRPAEPEPDTASAAPAEASPAAPALSRILPRRGSLLVALAGIAVGYAVWARRRSRPATRGG